LAPFETKSENNSKVSKQVRK